MESLKRLVIELYKEIGRTHIEENKGELLHQYINTVCIVEKITIRKRIEVKRKQDYLKRLIAVYAEESTRMYLVEYAFINNLDYDENSQNDIFKLLNINDEKLHQDILRIIEDSFID